VLLRMELWVVEAWGSPTVLPVEHVGESVSIQVVKRARVFGRRRRLPLIRCNAAPFINTLARESLQPKDFGGMDEKIAAMSPLV
jgi:hypothetical protein